MVLHHYNSEKRVDAKYFSGFNFDIFMIFGKALEIFTYLWYHNKCQEEICVILGVIPF